MVIFELLLVSLDNSDLMCVCNNSEVRGLLPWAFYGLYKLPGATIVRVEHCRRWYVCFDCSHASREVELLGVRRNISCLNGTFDNVVFGIGTDEPVMFAQDIYNGYDNRMEGDHLDDSLKRCESFVCVVVYQIRFS